MYYVEDKKIGYVVYETESLVDAINELESMGPGFVISDEKGTRYSLKEAKKLIRKGDK